VTDSPWKRTEQEVLRASMAEFQAMCKGNTRIAYVDPVTLLQLVHRGDDGDMEARRIVEAVTNTFKRFKLRKAERPVCLFCDTVFSAKRLPRAFSVIMPGHAWQRDEIVIVNALCAKCVGTDSDIDVSRRVAEVLFKNPEYVQSRPI
jgi:hypothetical protein